MSDDAAKALGEQVSMVYTMLDLLRDLQAEKGNCTMQELAEALMARIHVPLHTAQAIAFRTITHMSRLVEVSGDGLRLAEPPPPTIAETVAGIKAWMADLKPLPRNGD